MVRNRADEQERNETNEGTRRSFLRRAAVAAVGGGVAAAALQPSEAQAIEPGSIQLIVALRDIRRQENDHVTFLRNLLGGNARPKPTFMNIRRLTAVGFLKIAQTLENLTSGAYLDTLQNFLDPGTMAAAASIGFIEARHGTFFNQLLFQRITTNVAGKVVSFETANSQQDVLKIYGRFLNNLNGGPPLAYSTTARTPANDIAILNFLLALEFLQQEFYNTNVPIMAPGGIGGSGGILRASSYR